MNKIDRARHIQKRLEELYPNPNIPLSHKDSFTLLIAVVLSAQCTDKKVNEITPKLFDEADSPQKMVNLGEKKIYEHIKSIGLARKKAQYLYKLSKIICSKFNSEVPRTIDGLESLPGVGHKTASVVVSQAFGQDSFPVDTHIHRLAQRWGLTSGKSVVQTERDLKALFPKECWNKLHLQIIFYGRESCTARGCNGKICNICKELFPSRNKAVIVSKA